MTDAKTNREFQRETITFSDYSTEPVDPAVFTLEHYQLPVPNEAPEDAPATSWRVWAMLGAGCVGASGVLTWLTRRRVAHPGGIA